MPPHNLTYTCTQRALVWVGLFNAGSALSRMPRCNALFRHLAAAMGTVAWAGAEWVMRQTQHPACRSRRGTGLLRPLGQ